MNKACMKHLELTAYRLNLKDLLSGSSAPMFAVGCNNCHCLLFLPGHTTPQHIFKLPVMRDEHQGLSTMPNRNLETTRGWSFSARTHTHITTYFAHTHIMAQRGYEIETLVVPDSYILLHTVTRFMQSLLNHEQKDKKRDVGWTIPLFLYNSDAAKEEGRERWGSKGRKCFIILFVCVYTNASQPRFVSKETLTNEAQRIECDLKCLSFQ